MLVHICCSVDSHYFLQQLRASYPSEKLLGYFYNPNVHPYSEYMLRLQDVRYSCELLDIELIVGEYDINGWFQAIKGFENEPEKGSRCDICFDNRLENTIKMAKKLNQKSFTTTLLMSPKKSQDKLATIGNKLQQKHNIKFVFVDFRTQNGVANQSAQAKEVKLYRQNYCGCLYGLISQRQSQKKIASELMSNIGQQVQPNSIEEKLEFYAKRKQHTSKTKINFLNYRLLGAYIKISQLVVPSYFLIHSSTQHKQTKTSIELHKNGIAYSKNGTAIIISIDKLNKELNTHYKDTKELIYKPPAYRYEIALRHKITSICNSTTAIVVLDSIPTQSFLIYCDNVLFDDTKDILTNVF